MVARLGFGERRAVTLLLCLGIFRLQRKSALTSMVETLRALPFFDLSITHNFSSACNSKFNTN